MPDVICQYFYKIVCSIKRISISHREIVLPLNMVHAESHTNVARAFARRITQKAFV